jgi:hypothetical protein
MYVPCRCRYSIAPPHKKFAHPTQGVTKSKLHWQPPELQDLQQCQRSQAPIVSGITKAGIRITGL